MLTPLPQSFFARPADIVARALLGTVLIRKIGSRTRRCRIVETEAYMGTSDRACHAHKGLTARTRTLFGPPGHAYVYLCYGIHQMLNVVAQESGHGHAVLLRAAEALDGWAANLSGPGNLAKGLQITPRDNGRDLTTPSLYFVEGTQPLRVSVTARIGINYARDWKDSPLRFLVEESTAVSGGSRRRPAPPCSAPPIKSCATAGVFTPPPPRPSSAAESISESR